MRNIVVFAVFGMTIFQSCIFISAEDCPVNFQLPAEIKPYSEAYEVGDTIRVTSRFHKEVFETNTSQTFDMTGIAWLPGLRIYRIDNDSVEVLTRTKDYFDMVGNDDYNLEWFTYSSGASQIDGEYRFARDTFDIEIKVIPNTIGIYVLIFGSQLYSSGQDFPGKCSKEDFDVTMLMNEGEDNHIHLLSESPNPYFNDWILQKPQDRFFSKGFYCFRVVE